MLSRAVALVARDVLTGYFFSRKALQASPSIEGQKNRNW